MDRKPGIEPQLFRGLDLRCRGAGALALLDERGKLRAVRREPLRDRVIGGDCREARAEQRVGAGGEHVEFGPAVDHAEAEFQPLALADPVALHQPHLVGPLVEAIEPFEQLVGEIGDLQEPLAELALLDQRARTPAAPVDHLFVGQHGIVDRIPVDRRFLAIDQPCLEQIEEQCLFVPVIIGFARRQLAAPVERETQPLQLGLHRLDIGAGPCPGMHALFHRRIFGGHAERVPPHRVEHGMAGHPAIARQDIAHRIVADVPHMDAPRWIGKHLKHIGPRIVAGAIRAETLGRVPGCLPAGVRRKRVEAGSHDAVP